MAPTTRSVSKPKPPAEVDKPPRGMRKHRNGMLNVKKSYLPEVTLRNATESPLLLLPAELRTMIWNCALTTGNILVDSICITEADDMDDDYPPRRYLGDSYATHAPDLRMLFVCRQIYAEATLLPFVANTFYFAEPDTARAWLRSLCLGQRSVIQKISLVCFENQLNLIKQVPGLQSIYLDHEHAYFRCGCKHLEELIKKVFGENKVDLRINHGARGSF